LVALGFFSAGAADGLIRICLKLAMVYRTDPASMLSKSPDYIATLLEHTPDVLDDMIEANLYGR
jgi:hypothetical protein